MNTATRTTPHVKIKNNHPALSRVVLCTLLALAACLLPACQIGEKPLDYMVRQQQMQSRQSFPGGDSLHYTAKMTYYDFAPKSGASALAAQHWQANIAMELVVLSPEWDPQQMPLDAYMQQLIVAKQQAWLAAMLRPEGPTEECDGCHTMEVYMDTAGIYQTPSLLCISISTYGYDGGAHGSQNLYHRVISKLSGAILSYEQLVKDEAGLLQVAEQEFREQMGINQGEVSYEEFWFENGRFALPHNFTLERNTVVFTYNPYEIAPHSYGCISLRLPLDKVRRYIQLP